METFEKSDAVWRGDLDVPTVDVEPLNELVQVAKGTWFFNGIANMVMVETSEGLIIVDPGGTAMTQGQNGVREVDCIHKYKAVRELTKAPVHSIIYTHGHVDHIYGSDQYVNETKTKLKSWPCPQVIAHEAIIARLNRYRLMSGQIDRINRRQFSGADNISIGFSPNYITPNLLFRDALRLKIGDVQVQIKHGRGETDDHCWVYFPDTSVLCTGDFFIWAIPNAGNPQKVQRYALEWARELRAMAALNPKVLLPGHGLVILGEERVMQALDDTATLLESLHGQAVSLINQGLTLEEVVESVQVPNNLKQKPYLRPAYDETEFIVRNIWRLYGGWYDGIPSHLKPATEKAKAEEIVNLANGIGNLLARAEELLEAEEYRLATHFAEWAYWAEPENAEARALVRKVYAERAKTETSVMAKGIFRSAAREIEKAEQETGKA